MDYLYFIPAPHLPGHFNPLPPLDLARPLAVLPVLFFQSHCLLIFVSLGLFLFLFTVLCFFFFLSHIMVLCFPLFSPCYFPSFSSDFIGLFHLLCMPLSLSVFLLLPSFPLSASHLASLTLSSKVGSTGFCWRSQILGLETLTPPPSFPKH